MFAPSLRRIDSSKNKTESWISNYIKITNFPSTRDKKINTLNKLFQYQKIKIKPPKDGVNITPQNTTLNSNNGSHLIISSKQKPKFNSQVNFFRNNIPPLRKERENEKDKENEKEEIEENKENKEKEPLKEYIKHKNKSNTIYKRGKIINIINFSKISVMYNSFDNSKGNNTFHFQQPLTNRNNNKKIKFNDLEEYFNRKNKNIQQIRHEYKPDLKNFLINSTLRKYNKKSKEMNPIKNDINNLYKDSSLLNNILDYVGAKLYILRKDRNGKTKQELTKMSEDQIFKKIMKVKLKKGEISQDRLFIKKNYMTDDYKIKNRKKVKLIYKNGYSSNTFKVMLNKIKSQQQMDIEKDNKS